MIIPKYISTFELEEARLGQAMQATGLKLSPQLLKEIFQVVEKESLNIEYALDKINKKHNGNVELEHLLKWLHNKKS